ncbi:MAG: DUF1501 domain-containing protein [Cyclobacteriaceae bacterium]
MSRRGFIQKSALATAGTLLVPQFLKAWSKTISEEEKILIVLQLSGGNDGLNTIVPYRNDIYYKSRPKIGLPAEKIIKISDEIGFNTGLEKLRSFYDQGYMTIINNVGYPNPDRSHFRSMDIWQSGSERDYLNTGWIGRYLDATCNGKDHNAIEIDGSLSLALKGKEINALAMTSPLQFYKTTQNPLFKSISNDSNHEDANPLVDYLYKTVSETASSAEYIIQQTKKYSNTAEYPPTEFAQHLKTIGTLINSGVNAKVYYASLGAFDTHVNQIGQHERSLKIYADAVAALMNDLDKQGNLDKTVIMTFSEFGRRVSENASGGTDHGTASNVLLYGKKLKTPGVYNSLPDLANLDQGDLLYQVDFRSIYSALLKNWMSTDPSQILSQDFPSLNIV